MNRVERSLGGRCLPVEGLPLVSEKDSILPSASRSCSRQVSHPCGLWILLVKLTLRLALGRSFTGARVSVAINDLQVPDNKNNGGEV